MDRAGGMENAHETLAAECTGVEARFPHRLGRHKTPPTRSTGKIVVLFEHDVTGRTRAPVAKPMGGNRPTNVAALRRAFTFAGIRVHVPRIRRSTSPECARNAAVGRYTNRSRCGPSWLSCALGMASSRVPPPLRCASPGRSEESPGPGVERVVMAVVAAPRERSSGSSRLARSARRSLRLRASRPLVRPRKRGRETRLGRLGDRSCFGTAQCGS